MVFIRIFHRIMCIRRRLLLSHKLFTIPIAPTELIFIYASFGYSLGEENGAKKKKKKILETVWKTLWLLKSCFRPFFFNSCFGYFFFARFEKEIGWKCDLRNIVPLSNACRRTISHVYAFMNIFRSAVPLVPTCAHKELSIIMNLV